MLGYQMTHNWLQALILKLNPKEVAEHRAPLPGLFTVFSNDN
ncbi:hypothetical protein CORAM0001_1517 [Corynebacterium amycolatum SK46]|nr:hypothetical protein CORAM0001_1517 [Corynebacterium amycolatum SK46]